MKCPKCGNELKEGQKFCTKCGTPVSKSVQVKERAPQTPSLSVCPKCGSPLKENQKFCTKCGTPVGGLNTKAQANQKGWFTDGVRAVANAVTGGALNRDIQREQQQAVRRQMREDQGEIQEALDAQETAERAQRRAEEEAERARDRRNQEAIDGVDVVRGKAIWNIQPGEVARRITESEFNEIEGLKGVIIQEGCSAVVYVDGEFVGALSGGAYTFPVKSDAEKKKEKEDVEKDLKEKEERQKKEESFLDVGLAGYASRGLNLVRRFFFGNKKGESEQKERARKEKVDKILKKKTQPKLIRVYLVSDRVITLTFGGQQNNDGGIDFLPFTVATKIVDVEVAVSLQLQINNINDFLRNYLADQERVTTNQLQQVLAPTVQNLVGQMLRNLDYQQDGLPEPILDNLRVRILQAINQQLYGIQCIRVLQITDRSADFERFRQVERELYCSEKELGYLQRTGEFRNRLAIETNKQTIDQATSEEDLRYALQQINRDKLLHEDEMEQFVLMLNAQKRLREAKSKEEEYEALLDLKKSRLVKDDEMAALEDALLHNKIERDSVTEIMRIQHQQSVDDARLKAQWALGDMKQDHDWEREDLQRRRNWGIEDETREREWMHEEQEYNRDLSRMQQKDEYDWQKRTREDEYDWQRRIREEDYDWQKEEREREADWMQRERQREADWQQRQREEQMRREQEQMEFARQRQSKFDDIDILERKGNVAMQNMQAMKEAELRELQEQNRSAETIHGMDAQVTMNRDTVEANMSAEQLMAKRAAELSGEGQVAFAQALGSGKENELLQKQQQEQKELYEKMMQMQQMQGSQSQEMMMKMAQMMQQGMLGAGQQQMMNQQQMFSQQMMNQQQRLDDQLQRANEYKTDAMRQQDRMDRMGQQAMDFTTRSHQTDSQSFAQAMGGMPQQFQQAPQQQVPNVQPQQPQNPPMPQTKVTPQQPSVRHCPACGAEVPDGEVFCGECGNRM